MQCIEKMVDNLSQAGKNINISPPFFAQGKLVSYPRFDPVFTVIGIKLAETTKLETDD